MSTARRLVWQSAARTVPGPSHPVNEDAYLDAAHAGLWAVADGMGGHSQGDFASLSVCEALSTAPFAATLGERVGALETALGEVNAMLRAAANDRGPGVTIGAAVAGLVIHDHHAVCLWSGDSRAYLSRDDALYQLTRDHKLVRELVDSGRLSEAEAATHPDRHVITSAIGVQEPVRVEVAHVPLQAGDRLLLCTDGVSDCYMPMEIGEAMRLDPLSCVDTLLSGVSVRGGSDDATAVAISIEADHR